MLPASTSGDAQSRTASDNQTVRNVFVIDPDKKIKLFLIYPMTRAGADGPVSRIIESKCVIVDELVHSVLMQPNGIGIASDEFVDVDAIYCFGAPNSHLFPLNEYKHELLSSFVLRGLLSRGELLLPSCHIGNDP
jgi:hypothetical protein